jgi:hypothetical protein
MCDITAPHDKSPEPTPLALSVLLSRFTPRVGGGSAFCVRLLSTFRM